MEQLNLELHSDVSVSDDPSSFIIPFNGEIFDYSAEDERVAVGSISVFIADLAGAMNAGYTPTEVFDERASTACYMQLMHGTWVSDQGTRYRKSVRDVAGYFDAPTRVFVVHRVEVEERQRGRGIGLKAIRLAMRRLAWGCDFAALKPFPLQFEAGHDVRRRFEEAGDLAALQGAERAATRSLARHYKKVGFVPVPRTSLMIRPIGTRVSSFDRRVQEDASVG